MEAHTDEKCATFRQLAGVQAFQHSMMRENGELFFYCHKGAVEAPMPDDVRKAGFPAFFKWRLPRNILMSIRLVSQEQGEMSPTGCSYFEEAASRALAMPLNLLQGLVQFGLHERPAITVHVVGASTYELQNPTVVWEETLHLLAPGGMQKLDVVYVGPEVPLVLSAKSDADGWMDIGPCPECKDTDLRARVTFFSGIYEDYVTSQGAEYVAPDIALAFNSGMHAPEPVHERQWRGAAKFLLEKHVPWLLTSYTAGEAVADEAVLRKLGAHVVVTARSNPWRGLEPFLDPSLPDTFYHNNDAYLCVHGLAKDAAKVAAGDPAVDAAGSGSTGTNIETVDCTE